MSQQPGGDPPLILGFDTPGLEAVDPADDDDLEPISLVYDDDEIGLVDEPLASQPEDLDDADPDSDASLDVPDADLAEHHHDLEVTP